jgi:quinol-cytochrome oxidoreductase complex cytochrome b subunit
MLGSGTSTQSVFAVVLALAFTRLHISCAPYHDPEVVRCAEVALWQLFFVLFMIMVTQNTDLGSGVPLEVIDLILVITFFGNIITDIVLTIHLFYEWQVARAEGRVLDDEAKHREYVPFHRNAGDTHH